MLSLLKHRLVLNILQISFVLIFHVKMAQCDRNCQVMFVSRQMWRNFTKWWWTGSLDFSTLMLLKIKKNLFGFYCRFPCVDGASSDHLVWKIEVEKLSNIGNLIFPIFSFIFVWCLSDFARAINFLNFLYD